MLLLFFVVIVNHEFLALVVVVFSLTVVPMHIETSFINATSHGEGWTSHLPEARLAIKATEVEEDWGKLRRERKCLL